MLEDVFEETYGSPPTLLVRAPGRVNLIGEHIDYNGLPVFPMALQREVRLVLRPRDDQTVRLRSNDDRFAPIDFEIEQEIEPWEKGSWGNYAKAPAQELAQRFAIRRGFDGVLQSDIPVAAGLSSSSAIVNAVGLALAHINEVSTEPRTLAGVMADAEQYVGTQGGGMDQAISLGARERCAAKITFHPLRLRHVLVPDDWCFIVADSGEVAEKSGALRDAYNQRRNECDEALRIMTRHLATQNITTQPDTTYPDLCSAIDAGTLIKIAEQVLQGSLLRRFRHAVTEAARVEEAVGRMLAADLQGFGALMADSHESLRIDYHVSTPALDELVAVATKGGAAGARLTGAGFGGCVVALANRSTVGEVLETLVTEYFGQRDRTGRREEQLFEATPCRGASIREI
jgi:galactokinase